MSLPPSETSAPGSRESPLQPAAPSLRRLFGWLLWGDLAWSLRDRAIYSLVPIFLRSFGATDAAVGLIVGSLPQIIAAGAGPVIGNASDNLRSRWGRRIPLLFAGALLGAAALLGLSFSAVWGEHLGRLAPAWFPQPGTAVILVFAAFWAAFELALTAVNVLFTALINEVVPANLSGRFYGLFRTTNLLVAIAFNFAWLRPATLHPSRVFAIVALVYGGALSLMCTQVREGKTPARPPGNVVGPAASFRALLQCLNHPFYGWVFAAFTLATLAFEPVNLFGVFFAASVRMDYAAYGRCLAAQYLGSLLLAYPIGILADRFHPLRLSLGILACLLPVALLGYATARGPTGFGIAFVIHGVLAGAYFTATAALGQKLFGRDRFGQFFAAMMALPALGKIVLAPLVGRLLDQTGHDYRVTFLVTFGLGGAALAATAVAYVKFLRLGGTKTYSPPAL